MGKHINIKQSSSTVSTTTGSVSSGDNTSKKATSFICITPAEIETIRVSSYQYLIK